MRSPRAPRLTHSPATGSRSQIQGISSDPLTWAAPSMTPAGYPEIGYSSNNAIFRWVSESSQIVENFSAVRSAHTIKAGVTLQVRRMDTVQWGQPTGTYAFSGQFSAPVPVSATSRFNALADLLLGYPRVIPSRRHRFRPTSRIRNSALHSGRLESDPERHAESRAAVGILRPARGA